MKEIFEIVLLISASALCLALIYYISLITRSIESIRNELNKIALQINPLLESLNEVSRSVKSLSEDIREQLAKVNWIIDEIKGKIEAISSLENRIRESVETPAQNLMSNLTAVKNGLTAFFRALRRN